MLLLVLVLAACANDDEEIEIETNEDEVVTQMAEEDDHEEVVTQTEEEVRVLDRLVFIYQNIEEYEQFVCPVSDPGDGTFYFLHGTFRGKGCVAFNFMMINNAMNEEQTTIEDLYERGFRCNFDLERAKEEFGFSQYEFIDLGQNFTNDVNHQFANQNDIIGHGEDYFTLKEAIDRDIPVMAWMIPNADDILDNGHLITIYRYEIVDDEIIYYFLDTFNNVEQSRDLNDFAERWQFAQLHLLQ